MKLPVFIDTITSEKRKASRTDNIQGYIYPSIFSLQIEVIAFIILPQFFATRAVLKIGKHSLFAVFCCHLNQYFHFFVQLLYLFIIPLTTAATKCEQLRSQASANGLVGAYVPQCNEDGSFKSEQCWGSTGYCWCVDEYGKEMPGTRIRGKPDCSKKGN